ncbi:MAG: ribonuclease PH [Pseudomonadota bacterium]
MARHEGRGAEELRPLVITTKVLDHACGSALIETGKTKVLCAAGVERSVPSFLKSKGTGWVTAEYSMLPCSTHTRSSRERGTRIGGRTMEIQRLIGRSLRSVVNLALLGERTITVDCDVIQADGGTRTAAITGAWVAVRMAAERLIESGEVPRDVLPDSVAAVSVGIVDGQVLLDLDYQEDHTAEVDMNVVITGNGRLVEVQATAEKTPFSVTKLNNMIRAAAGGVRTIAAAQREALICGTCPPVPLLGRP